MAMEEGDEETYSLIFSSLKHPIRRKVLRILEHGEMAYSEILEILAIDSGHLSYHLQNLGDLIVHTQDGRYKLSSFGVAAVGLMGGVEEYNPPTVPMANSKAATYTRIFSVVLAITLVTLSLYSISLATSTQSGVAGWTNIPLTLAQNQTFSYPLNFTKAEHFSTEASTSGIMVATPDFVNAVNEWREYYLHLGLESNQTYMINVTVRDANEKVISSTLWGGDSGASFSGWTGAVIVNPGRYNMEIRNLNPDRLNANMSVTISEQHSQRPLFYSGLAGTIIASSFLMVVSASWLWARRLKITASR